jgi:citrate lyase subunit beta/citryl-CoA lyase
MDVPLRSFLYTPGHRESMVERVLGGGLPATPDVAILDLEDGVPPAEKEDARRVVARALDGPRHGALRIVRIGRSTSDAAEADLSAVMGAGLDGVLVPKVARAEELAMVDDMLSEHERENSLPVRSVPVFASIESAAGLLDAARIARSPRVVAVVFGSEDFAADLGLPVRRGTAPNELLYARSAIVVAAAAARIVAIDGIWADFGDSDGLSADTQASRRLGFAGRQCIHPSQIAVVNEAFGPTAEEIEHARRVVAAFEDGIARGLGAVALEGEMLDAPIVDRARRVLKTAGG